MAESFSLIYKSEEQLQKFLSDQPQLANSDKVLIQAIVHTINRTKIIKLQKVIQQLFPKAAFMGTTAEGSIMNGNINNENIVLTFTLFDHVVIHSSLIKDSYNNYFLEYNRNHFRQEECKLQMIFSTHSYVHLEKVLNDLHKLYPKTVVTGAVSNEKGIVFNKQTIVENGFIITSFYSSELVIHKKIINGWKEIGQRFQVTDAKDHRLLSINYLKPKELHKKYFGNYISNDMKEHVFEYPFMFHRNRDKKVLFPIGFEESGTFIYNEPISVGDEVSFSYLDIESFIKQSNEFANDSALEKVDVFFSFTNFHLNNITKTLMYNQTKMFDSIASVFGLITNKIIINKNHGLNLEQPSLMFIGISESQQPQLKQAIHYHMEIPKHIETVGKLTQLIENTALEMNELTKNNDLSEQYYQSLFENNEDFIYSTDLSGNILSVNQAFIRIFGYQKNEIIGKLALDYIDENDIPRVKINFFRALKGQIRTYRLKMTTKRGEEKVFLMKNIPITVGGKVIGTNGIGRDITESVEYEEKITQLAYYDVDTGLPNRMKFTEILNDQLHWSKKKDYPLAVIFLDIDRFKMINDTLGYKAGDEILKKVSFRLKNHIPHNGHLGRFSGDKFSIILSNYERPDDIRRLCKELLDSISVPIEYAGQEYYIAASIGISIYPNDGVQTETLLKNADLALNRCKVQGGNKFSFYSTEMNEQVKYRIELESYLRKALEKQEFFLCYQPIYHLKTGNIFGSEALIRWNHPKLGLIPPNEFIPLAEETGLIRDIGRWVLIESCKQNYLWQKEGLGKLRISVNVSPQQFQHEMFLLDVKEALEISGMDPKYLHLELTESVMLRNMNYSIAVMKELQDLGVKVSIDDFGTGYSSLNYLRNLPANTLKIDRSFIHNMDQDSSHIAIIKAIITMGKGLSMKIIAEGVETKDQLELLEKLNCHYAQGFYIHKPLEVEEFYKKIKVS